MIPRVCISILPKTITEALNLIDRAEQAGANIIEVRLDGIQKHERLTELSEHGSLQKIATNKLKRYRGQFKGSEHEQKQILLRAARDGFEYVDIELSATNLREFTTEVSEQGAKPIVSYHDFDHSLEIAELSKVLEQEIASGAETCKIVTTANSIEDNLTLLNFAATTCKKTNLVCFAMGGSGKISRLLSPLFGCSFTFAALESGRETASGQMTIQEMRTSYKLLGLR